MQLRARILENFDFLNPKIKLRKRLGEQVRVWKAVYLDVPVAVQNPPSMSATLRSEPMGNKMVRVRQDPAMVSGVTMEFTKLISVIYNSKDKKRSLVDKIRDTIQASV